jgi:hypothetical protein
MRNHLTTFLRRGSYLFRSLLLFCFLLPGAAVLQGNALKMNVVAGRPVVDGVYLNGQGPFRFLVDTGAQTNQMEASLVVQLDLKPGFRMEVATVAGASLIPGGSVSEVELGDAVAFHQEFLFTSLDAVHAVAPGVRGVLGEEFLSHFDYLLDFAGCRMVIGAREPESGSGSNLVLTDLLTMDGLPIIVTDKGKLILDSGAETAILFASSTGESGGRALTVSGSAAASNTCRLKFRVAGHPYSTAAALLPRTSLREDGVLPASLFRRVYVSNSTGQIGLEAAGR